jgi:hypothetical protein
MSRKNKVLSVVRRLAVGPTGLRNLPGIRTRNLLINYCCPTPEFGIQVRSYAMFPPCHPTINLITNSAKTLCFCVITALVSIGSLSSLSSSTEYVHTANARYVVYELLMITLLLTIKILFHTTDEM